MEIVSIDKIPKLENIKNTPVDNLMEVYKVCLLMEKICTENGGIGLSATQVGIPWNLFIVKHPDGYNYYLNCDYFPLGDINQKHMESVEGCLSLRNSDGSARIYLVERYPEIQIKGYILKINKELNLEDLDIVLANNTYTVVFQHEIDHSKGILISHIGKEMEIWK